MDPTVVAQLRAWSLAAIAHGLETVAAHWARLQIDGLPVPGTTLDVLRDKYRDLVEALPVAEPTDLEQLLQRYARGLRLNEERVTASQERFLRERLHLTARGAPPRPQYRVKPADDTWEWLRPLFQHAGSRVQRFTLPSALYVARSAASARCLPRSPRRSDGSCVSLRSNRP